MLSQTITRGSQTFTQSYGYTDGLNRLNCVNETPSATAIACGTGSPNWSRVYGYDPWANGFVPSYTGLTPNSFTPVAPSNFDSTNHLLSGSATYDGAGNQKTIGAYTFTYDAENRMTSSTITGSTTNYVYDGNGNRVSKTMAGATTTYVYDAMSQLIAEYGTPSDSGTKYITVDHLGSTRLVTDSTSPTPNQEICYDYLPFGEQIPSTTDGRTGCYSSSATPLTQKFTGKEREGTEAANFDYFLARYLSSQQERFTSPDRPFEDQYPPDPQTWNLFTYASNNPLRYTDPDGSAHYDPNGYWVGDKDGECQGVNGSTVCWNAKSKQWEAPKVDAFDFAGQWFVGFVDFFVYNKPKGMARMAYAYTGQLAPGPVLGVIGETAESVNSAKSLKTALSFEQAGILTEQGSGLTANAIKNAREIPISGGELTNPEVLRELTKDGSNIRDWGKFTTESVDVPGETRKQIHFYMNKVTGEVNLNIDFKVK